MKEIVFEKLEFSHQKTVTVDHTTIEPKKGELGIPKKAQSFFKQLDYFPKLPDKEHC